MNPSLCDLCLKAMPINDFVIGEHATLQFALLKIKRTKKANRGSPFLFNLDSDNTQSQEYFLSSYDLILSSC